MKDTGTPAVLASETLAQALVIGFACCEMNGRPLTQVQQQDMIASALMAYSGFEHELAGLNRATEMIEALRPVGEG